MYCMPFGVQSGYYPASTPMGEGNLNRIMKKDLRFIVQPCGGGTKNPRVLIYVWAETYNIFRVYGGRGTLLFSY